MPGTTAEEMHRVQGARVLLRCRRGADGDGERIGKRINTERIDEALGGTGSLAYVVTERFRDERVRVICILLSVIDTPANRAAMPNARHHRWPKPTQLAAVLAFLISDNAVLISEAAIPSTGWPSGTR